MNNDLSGAIVAIIVLVFALIVIGLFVVSEFAEIKDVSDIGEAYLSGQINAKTAIKQLTKIDDGSGYKDIIIAFIMEDVTEEESKEVLKYITG